ncbi:MAG: cytochrome c [Chloroflexi bacterium]|nr:cytochrome c [Chloroflexota bacterium]
MRKFILIVLLVLSLSMVLAACGGSDDEADGAADNGVGNVANGEKLFNRTVVGSASAPGCITCHSLDAGVVLVGPDHSDIGTRAETAVSGMSAEDYIRESIVDPNAQITEGYAEGVMYQNYGTDLPAPQIDDIVAYMLTLK